MTRSELSSEVLAHIANHCAFRSRHFQVAQTARQAPSQLAEMVRFNFEQELGWPCDIREEEFSSKHAVIVDGRLQPHEWIRTRNGILKTDAATHGDDHFFPGPTDILWDLAGAVVEWNMRSDAAEDLLRGFQQTSGINGSSRLSSYLVAYSIFRTSYCRMAASAVHDPAEKERFNREHAYYRDWAQKALLHHRRQ